MNVKKILKNIWNFIWDSNSIWSWLVDLILAYMIIQYIFFPVLGFLFSTQYPITAVMSGSMEHDGNFNEWWDSQAVCGYSRCTQEKFYTENNITKEQFLDFRYKNGFNKGDWMIVIGKSPEKLRVGDVIIFNSYLEEPIIHRIIDVDKVNDAYYFKTKGDHNLKEDTMFTNETDVLGKAVVRIPFIGWVKIIFTCPYKAIAGKEQLIACLTK